jgi:hypothetical protein
VGPAARSNSATPGGPTPPRSKREARSKWEAPLDLTARIEASAPTADAKFPSTWTLRWVDEGDPAGGLRSWSGAAAPEADWSAFPASVASTSGRAFFALRGKQGGDVMTVSPRGTARRQHLEHVDVTDARLAAGEEAPVLWHAPGEQAFYVWHPGRPPQVAAKYDREPEPGVSLMVGEAWHDAVPVGVFGNGRFWVHDVPLAGPPADFAPRSWKSWALPDPLPPCDTKSSGPVMRAAGAIRVRFTVDGDATSTLAEPYVQLRASGACLAGLSATLPRSPSSKDDRLSEVRVSLVDGTGVGSEVGSSPKRRSLKCGVESPK